MSSIFLATMFLFTDPTGAEAPVCEDAQEVIDTLEAEAAEHEAAILVLDGAFFDFFFATTRDTTASCADKPTTLEQQICECIAEGAGVGTGLTACIVNKQSPTGG